MTNNSTAITSKESISKIQSLMKSLGLSNNELEALQKQSIVNDTIVVSVPLKTKFDINRAKKILSLFF